MTILERIRDFALGKDIEQDAVISPKPQTKTSNVWSAVLERWERVEQLNPNDINAKVQIILAHFNIGNIDKADKLLARLLQQHPDDLFVRLVEARHAQRTERYEEAEECWKRLAAENPSMSEPLVSLANINIVQENYDKAHSLANKALELDPNDYHAVVVKGRIYHRSEQWGEAVEAWRLVLSKVEKNFEAELQLASALTKIGNYQEADQLALASLEKHEFKVPFLQARLKANTKLGNDQLVIEVADQILALQADNKSAIHAKAYALFRKEEYELSEQACNYALQVNENDMQMMTLYARIAQTQAKAIKAA